MHHQAANMVFDAGPRCVFCRQVRKIQRITIGIMLSSRSLILNSYVLSPLLNVPVLRCFFADDWIKEVCEMYKKETETKMKIHNALLEQIREPAKTEISQQSDTLEVWLP